MVPKRRPSRRTAVSIGAATKSGGIVKKKKTTKKRKGPVFIPRDFLLDGILPLLSKRQLYSLRFVKRDWKRLIETGVARGQLPSRTVLYKITFMPEKRLPYAINLGDTHPIEMGDQEMEEEEDKAALKSVLEKGLALVAVESADTSQYSTTMGDSYCAYIDPEKGCGNDRRLLLELPTRPGSISELRFVRYWLRQLARAHFTQGEFRWDSLNRGLAVALNTDFVRELCPAGKYQREDLYLSFGTLKTKDLPDSLCRSLASLTRIDHLKCRTSPHTSIWDHIEFLLACRRPIRSAQISPTFSADVGEVVAGLAKSLKELEAGQLRVQLPARIDFQFWAKAGELEGQNAEALKWENDEVALTMASLQASSGLVHHVQTREYENAANENVGGAHSGRFIEFAVVECAVEARITLKVVDQSVWGLLDLPWLSQILVEIGAPSAAVNSSADNNKEQPAAKKKKKRLTKKKKKKP